MAPPQYRGAINNGFELCISIGILIANVINYGVQKIEGGWGWRISLSMAAVPAAFLTIGAIFLPETPSFLIQRDGNVDEAKMMLQRLLGTMGVQKELDDLVTASNISRAIKNPYRNILKNRNSQLLCQNTLNNQRTMLSTFNRMCMNRLWTKLLSIHQALSRPA